VGIRLHRVDVAAGAGDGIYVDDPYTSNFTIDSNICTNFTDAGVYVATVSDNCHFTVSNNTLTALAAGATYGVYTGDLDGGSTGTITGNTATDFNYAGFYSADYYYGSVLTVTNNTLNGIGPTPIQLVAIDRSAIFTSPQSYDNSLAMTSLNGNYIATDTLSVQSSFYLRSAGRKVSNGNTTEVERCERSIPNTLCFGNDDTVLFDISGRPVPNILGGKTPGQIDSSKTTSLGLGGSLQGTSAAPLFGHDNRLVVGASLDHAGVNFGSINELGTINPANLVVSGTGIIIDQPDGSLTPTLLQTTNSYYGIYATDTFDVTPRLAVTLAGRFNLALIRLIDKRGTALNGNNRFSRFNPSAGATYKITPEVTGYFGYAEANRTPTSGEIACSDPMRPCSLDNFLSADPPGV
jgi:iron complex outermembrane receptor protein